VYRHGALPMIEESLKVVGNEYEGGWDTIEIN